MKISYIYLLLAVNFVTTVVTYYKKCYGEFSVCLIANTDDPNYRSKFRLNQTSANDWCEEKSSSLARITNENIQSALAEFIKDSSAKLDSDVITNGHRFKLKYWKWTNGVRSDINPALDRFDYRYAYVVPTGSNATLFAYVATFKTKFICSSSLNDDSGCRDGYDKYNKMCYNKHNEEVTWFAARSRCLQEGDDLATFDNNDLSLISKWPSSERYWIGLRKEKWIWRDGGRSLEIKYSNWDDSRPHPTEGDCLCLTAKTEKWKDCDCSQNYRYICIQDYVPDSSAAPANTTTIQTTTATTQTTSSSTPTTTIPDSHTVSRSIPIPTADDNSKNKAAEMQPNQSSRMLLMIGLGIACLVILIVVVTVVVSIKLRRSQSHEPEPSHDSPSTTSMTREDAPNNVYAVVMPSQSIRSPSEKSPNKIIYAELDLVPKGNTRGTAPQECVYANSTQPHSVYANCSDTRV